MGICASWNVLWIFRDRSWRWWLSILHMIFYDNFPQFIMSGMILGYVPRFSHQGIYLVFRTWKPVLMYRERGTVGDCWKKTSQITVATNVLCIWGHWEFVFSWHSQNTGRHKEKPKGQPTRCTHLHRHQKANEQLLRFHYFFFVRLPAQVWWLWVNKTLTSTKRSRQQSFNFNWYVLFAE